MTNDLISREALKKAISKLPNNNPSYYYTGDLLDREKVLDEIDNTQAAEISQGEWVRGFIDALDKASLMFDTDRTYSGERVLQMLAKLKWLEKLKEEKGSAE